MNNKQKETLIIFFNAPSNQQTKQDNRYIILTPDTKQCPR